MPLIVHEDKHLKVACSPCIKGHRSNKCVHIGRLLIEVRKPGRPLATCPHDEACNGECSQQPTFKVPGRGERARCDDPSDVFTNAIKSDKRVDYPKTARKEAQRLKTRLIKMKPQVQHVSTCGAQSACHNSNGRASNSSPDQLGSGKSTPPSTSPSHASPASHSAQQQPSKRSCCGGGNGGAATLPTTMAPCSPMENYLPQTLGINGERVRLSLLGVRGPENGGYDPMAWQGDWPSLDSEFGNGQHKSYANLPSAMQAGNVGIDGTIAMMDSTAPLHYNGGFARLHADSESSIGAGTPTLTAHGSTLASLSPTFMSQSQELTPFSPYSQQQQGPDPWTEMPSSFRARFNSEALQVIQESVIELTQGQQGQCTCDASCRCVFCAKHPYNPATLDQIMNAYNSIKGNTVDESSGDDYQKQFRQQSQQGHGHSSRPQSLNMADMNMIDVSMADVEYQHHNLLHQQQQQQQQQDLYASNGGIHAINGNMSNAAVPTSSMSTPLDFVSRFNLQMIPDGPRSPNNQIPPNWLIR